MTPEYYLSQLKAYSRFVRNFNPAQEKDPHRMLKIAVGPGGDGPRWTEWTDAVMKAWQGRSWSWDMDGLSLHNYTVPKWPPSHKSIGFGESRVRRDPEDDTRDGPHHRDPLGDHGQVRPAEEDRAGRRRVGRAGTRRCRGRNPGFLAQQNSLRDAVLAALNINIFARHADRVRMANIAQMVNVLQAMILTDKEKMVLTPTYHVFRMYVPFQDATFVPVRLDAGTYTQGDITLPRVDAIAARDKAGKLWLAVTNLDPNRPVTVEASSLGRHAPDRRRANPHRAPGRQREHLRCAQHRRPEADRGEDQRRHSGADARAQVGDRDLGGAVTR